MNKVLITGGGGYIGTQLIKDLFDNKYTVKCLDRFYFGIDIISPFIKNDNFLYVRKDIRSVNTQDFADFDSIFGLFRIFSSYFINLVDSRLIFHHEISHS